MKVETEDIKNCPWCGEYKKPVFEISTFDYSYKTCTNEFNYYSCKKCNSFFLKNRPLISQLEIIYPKTYSTYDYKKSLGISFYLKEIFSKYKIFIIWEKIIKKIIRKSKLKKINILEVGCGGGDYLVSLKRNIEYLSKKKVISTGLDFKSPARDGIDHSISGDISKIDLEAETYDLIICYQLIEHVANPKKVLDNMTHSLKNNGEIIIETPYINSLDFRLFKEKYWAGWHAPRHWIIINTQELINYLEDLGYKVKKTWTPCPYMWIETLRTIMPKKFKRLFSITNPFLVIFFTLVDYIWLFLGGKTSNVNIRIIKS